MVRGHDRLLQVRTDEHRGDRSAVASSRTAARYLYRLKAAIVMALSALQLSFCTAKAKGDGLSVHLRSWSRWRAQTCSEGTPGRAVPTRGRGRRPTLRLAG